MTEERMLPPFADEFAAALAALGFPRMPARLLSAVLATPEDSLTARELAHLLGVSPAAISGAAGYLGRLNLIRRTRTRGERADRLGVGTDVWAPVIESELGAYGSLIDICRRAEEGGELSGPGRERVAETRAFLEFMNVELAEVLRRWRQRKRG